MLNIIRRNEALVLRNQSDKYWAYQARKYFDRHPDIHTIEVVHSGRKTESQYISKRGAQYPPDGIIVILASTGGAWGKSRRNFFPLHIHGGL